MTNALRSLRGVAADSDTAYRIELWIQAHVRELSQSVCATKELLARDKEGKYLELLNEAAVRDMAATIVREHSEIERSTYDWKYTVIRKVCIIKE
jgi:hypothetical protein